VSLTGGWLDAQSGARCAPSKLPTALQGIDSINAT
jgi:hypothetical protein